jgi:two-component system, NarL family, invasion response regulator UvrY
LHLTNGRRGDGQKKIAAHQNNTIMEGKNLRLLHLDDHPLILIGAENILKKGFHQIDLVGITKVEQAKDELRKQPYDIVILDIHFDEDNGLDFLKYVKDQYPNLPILIYSYMPEAIYGLRVFQLGVKGFLSKTSPRELLVEAVQTLVAGKRYLSERLKEHMISNIESNKYANNPFEGLSYREFEIVQLMLDGKPLKEICNLLNLRASTVSTHKARAFDKLGISSAVDLKSLATIHGL